ncbi:MAG: hypothetical protein JXA90_03220 [Planctomycetes bacterium]|nr:hypothetical protein [Planctomycetota bacterium]
MMRNHFKAPEGTPERAAEEDAAEQGLFERVTRHLKKNAPPGSAERRNEARPEGAAHGDGQP